MTMAREMKMSQAIKMNVRFFSSSNSTLLKWQIYVNFPYGILGNPPKFSYAPAPNTVETWYNEPLYNKFISITKGRYKEKKLDYNGKHILPVLWGIILSHFSVCSSISQIHLCLRVHHQFFIPCCVPKSPSSHLQTCCISILNAHGINFILHLPAPWNIHNAII